MIEDDGDDGEELDPLHEVFEQWSSWIRNRRMYKAPSAPPSILGRLTAKTRAPVVGRDVLNSAELQALNTAIEAEPIHSLDRHVFELHYRQRVKPIKTFADAMGISRRHWYTVLRAFEQRVHANALGMRECHLTK